MSTLPNGNNDYGNIRIGKICVCTHTTPRDENYAFMILQYLVIA